MNTLILETPLIITTPEGYSFNIRNQNGKLVIGGESGLVSAGEMFDYTVTITHMKQFEKGLTPNEIRAKIK